MQTRVITAPLNELGLSDSGNEITSKINDTESHHKTSENPSDVRGAVNLLSNKNTDKDLSSSPGGVWGPSGYTRATAPNTYHNSNQGNLKSVRKNNAIFPPIDADIALSYYKSTSSSYNRAGPGLGPMNPFGERSVSFSPDRAPTRQDMPSILRSILKQENIDYQNDFYWMNRFQEDKMKDPLNFERALGQSISLLGKQHSLHSSQLPSGSTLFDSDINNFNSHSISRSSRAFRNDIPLNSKGSSRSIKSEKGIGIVDRGMDRGDHSGFCFTLPEGSGGMGNSLGPGFESSILGGSMMRREGGYSQMGTGMGIADESVRVGRGGDELSNHYTVLPQQKQQQQQQQQQQFSRQQPAER